MSSITKNPMILQSALYIYNWFLALPEEQRKFIDNNNMLNHIESDEKNLYNIENIIQKEKEQENIEERFNKILKSILKEGDSK